MKRVFVSVLVVFCWALPAIAGPPTADNGSVRIGEPQPPDQPKICFSKFDHAPFDYLLRQYVDDQGLVAYGAWKSYPDAVGRLECYLRGYAALDVRNGDAEPQARLATYINAYNALVIWGILREYPTASIQVHNREGAAYRIFDNLELCIDGQYQSLNTIEHEVLRPLGEPRIHFAIVCAAKGCPRLRNEAYTADRLESQLSDNAQDFFSSTSRWRIARVMKRASVSPILKWFHDDFGRTDGDVFTRILPYLPAPDQQWVVRRQWPHLTYLGYNWALNDQHPPPMLRAAAMTYALYSKFEPTVRPLVSLVRTEKAAPQMTTTNVETAAPAVPLPAPSGDDEPAAPKALKPKVEKPPAK